MDRIWSRRSSKELIRDYKLSTGKPLTDEDMDEEKEADKDENHQE